MTNTAERRALVTGGTRGIGRAAAIALASSGWDVAVTGRTARRGEGRDDSDAGGGRVIPGSLEETVEEIEAADRRALGLVVGLHDRSALVGAVAQVGEAWGGVDLLVNNAVDTSPGSMVSFDALAVAQFETKLTANVVAPFVLIQAVLPGMLARGAGIIVDVTSHAATADPPAAVGEGGWGVAYASSKAAAHRFAPALAVELGHRGIRAYNVDPGYVETERQVVNAEALGLSGRYRGAPPSVPGAAIAWLVDHPDACENGATVQAQKVALTHGLHEDWRR